MQLRLLTGAYQYVHPHDIIQFPMRNYCLRCQVLLTFLLAILPGLTTPTSEQMQFIMKPIVDDFLRLWRGIRIKTPDLPEGMSVFSSLQALH